MKCPQCGQDNPGSARFCNGCEVKLETRCAACGQAHEDLRLRKP